MKIKTLISFPKEDRNRPAACSRPVIIDGHRFLLSTNSKLFLVEDGTAKVIYAYGTDTYPLQTQHGTAISSDPDRIAYLSPIYQNGQILVPLFTRIDGRPFHNIDILDMEGRLSLTIRVPAVEPSSIRPVIYSSSASIFYIDHCSIRIFSWDGSRTTPCSSAASGNWIWSSGTPPTTSTVSWSCTTPRPGSMTPWSRGSQPSILSSTPPCMTCGSMYRILCGSCNICM